MLYLWIALGICCGLALIALFVWLNNSLLTTTEYTVKTEKLPAPVRIVHLSDLHGKSFGSHNSRLVARVARLRPDFIVITGDIIHKYTDKYIKVALSAVSSLSLVAPVLYVSGNHELRGLEYRLFAKQLKEAGATVLDDCSADICGLTVTGLKCSSQKNGAVQRLAPSQAAQKSVNILLAHKPHFLEAYAPLGFDLILSGHAHGGQWRIPFTKTGIYAPGQGLFPKLTSGLHTRGNTKMIISRGLGNSECPLRLFNPPELVVINLQ